MSAAREVALPEALRAALERLLGERVGHVRIIENSRFARLHPGALATTRRGCIYLRFDAASFFSDPRLVLHEYWHVIGQWQRGELTVARYLLECLRHGYTRNRFEVEARAFADAHAPGLRALLAGAARAAAGGAAGGAPAR